MISVAELKELERYLDKVWKALNIDVEFSKHFIDRANDERNKKPIEAEELRKLFTDAYKKYGKKFSNMRLNDEELEGILADITTKVNAPFVLKWDRKNREFDLVAKTVMRKNNFVSNNPGKEKKYTVEEKEMTKVAELIEKLETSDVVGSMSVLESIMLDRLGVALSEKKQSVVSTMFESKDEDEDDEDEDDMEDDEDDMEDDEDENDEDDEDSVKVKKSDKIEEAIQSYRVETPTGVRTVQATSEKDAINKAMGNLASFAKKDAKKKGGYKATLVK